MIKEMNLDPHSWKPPVVAVIGMGMCREDLTARAIGWIMRAEVLAGGKRHTDLFPEHEGERLPVRAGVDEFVRGIDRISRERRVAVLASGDPFFFGIGRRLAEELGRDRIVSFPNVTSVQTLFSRLALPWEDVGAISLHGRGEENRPDWLRQVRDRSRTAVFTDPEHTPAWIARRILDAGYTDRRLVVAEDMGLPSERIRFLGLEEAAACEFSPLNLVAVLPKDTEAGARRALEEDAVFGLPEEAFQHEAGMITKMEVRAVALALLRPAPGLTLWDIGAGSGAVSVEAARIAPLKRVYAVEKDPRRLSDLRENIRRFRRHEIEAVPGKASEVLDRLPDPDRVFIGGGGDDLRAILEQVERRLRPGGRVVLTAVMLDTLELARSFWREKSFEVSVTQIQAGRSAPIGGGLRLEALNPVFIVCARRLEER